MYSKFLAPWLALAALGVRPLEVAPANYYEIPASRGKPRKTGIAASKRAAQKRKNQRKSR